LQCVGVVYWVMITLRRNLFGKKSRHRVSGDPSRSHLQCRSNWTRTPGRRLIQTECTHAVASSSLAGCQAVLLLVGLVDQLGLSVQVYLFLVDRLPPAEEGDERQSCIIVLQHCLDHSPYFSVLQFCLIDSTLDEFLLVGGKGSTSIHTYLSSLIILSNK
jgi:hypothetical protein